jgi:hypothetical protein
MRRLRDVLPLAAFVLLLLPSSARAQATVTGVVRDNTGAVLPGVTVEASSAALIEKSRIAVTDPTGQYRITELPPGVYVLTFTLSGFSVARRDDVEVRGSGVIPINAELRVGTLQETITVTGESPLVDTQSTRREMVLTSDTINSLPATRSYGALLNAIPGLSTNTGSTSAMATPDMTFFTANGGRQNGGQVQIDGMPVAASFNGGGVSTFTYDIANAAEMQVLVSGGLGEAENGEPRINLVPQAGGNRFRGQGFYSGAGKWSASNNITPELQAKQITAPPTILKLWDASGSFSGPVLRDRLWFFGNVRQYGNYQTVEGVYGNQYAGDATRWDFARNTSVQARTANSRDIFSGRLTAQITEKNRLTFYHEYQHRCSGSTLQEGSGCRSPGQGWIGLGTGGNTPAAPESWPGYHDFPYYVTQIAWTSPVSSKLLLDAGFSRFHYLWAGFGQAPPDRLNLIPVTETQAIDDHRANFTYRGIYDPIAYAYADNDANPNNWKAALSYVTGAHSMKFGYQGSYQKSLQGREANTTLLRYVFNNRQPTGFGFYLTPRWEINDRTATQSLYAQDQWTLRRVTLQGAVRYDRAWSWAPSEHNGSTETSQFMPAPITFPRTVSVAGYNDITTRWGAAWDVFGDGRTALKANIGKYLQTATNDENYAVNNPAGLSRFVTFVTNRSWTDNDQDRVIDCQLMTFGAQSPATTGSVDTCGALGGNNLNFGNPNPNATVVNPEILKGWGVRPSDWGLNVSVQHEVLPRVSVEVGYNRRWFQNFFVTDNRAVSAADYEPWTFTAPQNEDLPGGGGYPINLQAISAAAFTRPAQNYITFETDYGDARKQYWHGVTVSATARLNWGLTVQGGTTTGRGVRDRCDTAAALPEEFLVAVGSSLARTETCDVTEPWMTSVRGLASYTVPWIDVLVSANFRSLNPANALPGLVASVSATNGASLNANAAVPNAVVQASLGRIPGGGQPTGTTTINLLRPGELYPDERVNQLDMRLAKIIRFGARRVDIGIDAYNLFNTGDATGFDQSFTYTPTATNPQRFLWPTSIVSPRFARFNLTLSF